MNVAKSVITCDLEGRIETFNPGAEAVFGYKPEEVIHKKRVSAFSPGLIVLGHVGGWLETAKAKGEYSGRTVFVNREGQPFAAQIRITPTFRGGEQIGYCGVTEPLPDVKPEEVMPPISFGTRALAWLVVTRAPFLTATLTPVAMAAAWVLARNPAQPFKGAVFGLALLGAALLHVAANTFNDYFDWKSGTDQANNEYFQAFSGGSRSVELGLITMPKLLAVAIASVVLAALTGVALVTLAGPTFLGFGLAGALGAYFYTAPPLRLCARKGMGELVVGLCFGPLIVAGTVAALTGGAGWADYAAGLPLGLLTTAILWVNEFPDAVSDAATGKHTLVVVLGKKRARWGYAALLVVAFAAVPVGVFAAAFPVGALAMLLALPLAVVAIRRVFAHYEDRALAGAAKATIALQFVAGVLLAGGMAAQVWLAR